MPTATNGVWSFGPEIFVLDDLELLRDGALGKVHVGPSSLVRVEHEFPAGTTIAVITDPEGVPVAQLPVRTDVGGESIAEGVPRWLAQRSARPFEALHRAPGDVVEHQVLVVVDASTDVERLASLDLAPNLPVLLLVLASTDAEGAQADLDSVRAGLRWAQDRPAAQVVIAPLGRSAPEHQEKKDRTIAAYARGLAVHDLTTAEAVVPHPRGGGVVLFFTGLSGSGKSTIARVVRNWLVERGRRVTLLDGDLVRRHLSAGLGFSAADRHTNIRRIGWVAAEIAGHGGLAICSPIAPFEQSRGEVRQMVEERGGRFVLVHVATPLAECERRDRKGLYAKARRGEIPDFTGITSPYQEPAHPDLRLDTTDVPVEDLRERVLAVLDSSVDERSDE